jgi:hypothetical protein
LRITVMAQLWDYTLKTQTECRNMARMLLRAPGLRSAMNTRMSMMEQPWA